MDDLQPRWLIELFLPTTSNGGTRFAREMFDRVRDELLEGFGGVTLFSRSPAEGLWAAGRGEGTARDRVITAEVMADSVDRDWWARYRRDLEARFSQEEILIRCYRIWTL
ncbi:hypothetical protein [Sphingomonas desiccabilis]|uniref:hypothetical protein n=1 Tax=Sphingomonas desiccabilis TaxID=429134 RepID=UPI00183D276A|nr:hypothetical protein [Sphingomonas desiccabilis]MBB3911147.1 hypothetical protein [Sphingomonas desiccabilis]